MEELRVNEGLPVGVAGVGVHLIAHVKVVEAGLQHKRGGLGLNAVGGKGGAGEQRVDLPPGHIVANGDGGVQNESVKRGVAAEVGGVAAHHTRIGQGNDLVFGGAQAGH